MVYGCNNLALPSGRAAAAPRERGR